MTSSEALNGNPSLVACERALSELRRGRAISLLQPPPTSPLLAAALETADSAQIDRLRASSATPLLLALTAPRAQALGLAKDNQPVLLELPASLSTSTIVSLVKDWSLSNWQSSLAQARVVPLQSGSLADERPAAALQLIKSTQLLPAVLLAAPTELPAGLVALPLTVADITRHAMLQPSDLQWVSEASVPLRDCEDSHLVLFRDRRDSSEHLAVRVGRPDYSQAVPLRMHSACLTGDLLGSLRCDCGEQLNTAVRRLAEVGGGLLLYLTQEGRGIGLANKLRAYQLQDQGLDTIDANLQLGFSSDERRYEVAAAMLQQLQVKAVTLLTNSPHKVSALRAAGITVADIATLPGTPNPHNARYIRTKQDRAGHSRP